jgi:TPR repeat protein
MISFRQKWVWVAVSVIAGVSVRGQTAPAWPDGTPAQIREDVFGVRFRQIREIDGPKSALTFLKTELAQRPSPAAKAYYGWVCLFAEGWDYPEMKDIERGMALVQEAKNEGSLVARDVLARAKGMGVGGPANSEECAVLLAEAADAGAPRSMGRLAYYYAVGYGLPVNLSEADRLARKAAELGQTGGLMEIAEAYEAGAIGGKPDMSKAMEYLYAASCHSEPGAWKKLKELDKKQVPQAKLYAAIGYVRWGNLSAWIAPSRIREHIATLTQVVGEHAQGLTELGHAHMDGVYAKKDYKLAHDYLNRAAAQGNIEARFYLAKMTLRGWGEPARPAEALAAIHQLADGGCAEAANYLGYVYYWQPSEAPGILKSPEKAFHYVRQAAEKGHPYAVMSLAQCYEDGIGTQKNNSLAAKMYWQAYLRGFVEGRNRTRSLMAFIKNT